MAKLKIAAKESNGILHDQYTGPSKLGGTGGANQAITSTGVKTIAIAYNTTANAQIANGYIVAQKGAHKFRVVDQSAANATTVTLVNATGNLRTASQGTITGYNTSNVAFNASRITNKFVYDFAGNKMRYVLSPTVAGNGFANVASY
jgi:hypothetical protein